MKPRRRLAPDRRGVSAVLIASMFLILLTFSTLALLLSGFFGYNVAINEQMKFDQERTQEKIILTELKVQDIANETYLTAVRVNNTGTISVRIRAIYETNRTMTAFLGDPSTWMETYIEPNDDLLIWGPEYTPITHFHPSAKLTLVTERGTKTSDYEGIVLYGPSKPEHVYDTSRFYIGPLELMFTAFYYRNLTQNGELNPNDYWHPGWNIFKGFGGAQGIAWNLTVRNIDNRTISINKFSSFTIVPNESPPSNDRTWYLEPNNQTTNTQTLIPQQLDHIVYKWDKPKWEGGFKAQQIYDVSCRCLVFLTFYGWFHEPVGPPTPYAQTIPFEAAITVI